MNKILPGLAVALVIYRNDVLLVAMGYLYSSQLIKPMTAEMKL